jgi:hypothetical protein
MCSGSMNHFYGHDLVSALLKASYDLSDEVTLDTIRLDHDEAAFRIWRRVFLGWFGVAAQEARQMDGAHIVSGKSPPVVEIVRIRIQTV